jgi:hypothetical protein
MAARTKALIIIAIALGVSSCDNVESFEKGQAVTATVSLDAGNSCRVVVRVSQSRQTMILLRDRPDCFDQASRR